MIEIKELIKVYNGNVVVDISSLVILPGETIGLVGNNGAGKTTFFRMMLDLIRADRGTVFSKDQDVAASENWKNYTASYLDEGFLIEYLSPEEYFYFVASFSGKSRTQVDQELEAYSDFFNDEILGKKKLIRDLSKGNQCKVGIVACLLQEPEFLLLDEPFANIDPSTQIRLKNLIRRKNQEKNMTILISSHDLNHVTEICERIVLMEKGKVIKDIKTTASTREELETYFSVMQ